MTPWFVLFSKPRKERQLRDELTPKGITVYLPLLPAVHPGEAGSTRHPLFPRYLFARIETPDTSLESIRWTPGLVSVVSFAGEPATVDEPILDYIRQRLAQMEHRLRIPFEKGQHVRLPAGHPLAQLDAVFDEPMSDGRRAYVLIEVLGRLTRCKVELSHLHPADNRNWPFA